jgi:ABC-type Fe3+-siderophore transport system permease subunit
MTGGAIESPARPAAPSIRRRLVITLLVFGTAAVATVLLAPLVGPSSLSLSRVFDRTVPFAQNPDAQIFFIARLPRVLAAAIVGCALATSGVVFQALLRNPLASPDTLGVSAGAALGAIVAITFNLQIHAAGLTAVPMASFLGAGGALLIVYLLSAARRQGLSTNVLLLAGVTMNAFFAALILFVQYLADFTQTFQTVRWLMGDLDVAGYAPIAAAAPLVLISLVAFSFLLRPLNLLSLGTDAAAARGVDVAGAQRLALFSASLATGAAVALAGPIGFIGIIVPHLVRLLVGPDHRLVLPASACFGAMFLVGCDLIARTAFAPLQLPVGIITAVVGGPFFLWLLLRQK